MVLEQVWQTLCMGVCQFDTLSADAGPVLPVLLQIHLWFLSLALLQTLCQIRDGVFDLCS